MTSRLCKSTRLLGLIAVLLVSACFAEAQELGCPAGTVQVGTQDEQVSPTRIVVHPLCQRTTTTASTQTYRPSGSALIGGTDWITGYNVQKADRKLMIQSQALMARQMKLAGMRYSEGVDFDRYNFVLGIAASTDTIVDLGTRVIFDEYSNGQYTANEQAGYAALKGRQFDELGCHSNGAMICLAALENKDVVADRVVLFGPQLTVESLRLWDELVRSGRVKSVEVYINQSDPVPPLSLAIGGGAVGAASIASLALLRTPTLKDVIEETSPRLTVRTHDCGTGEPNLDCHDSVVYKANRDSSR